MYVIPLFSVVLKPSHPYRPVLGLDTAGFGPMACRVEMSMPFKLPQLFESELSYGPVGEQSVDKPIVPIKTEPLHLVVVDGLHHLAVILRRVVGVVRPSIVPSAIQEHRNVPCPFGIDRAPVLFRRPAVQRCHARRGIA